MRYMAPAAVMRVYAAGQRAMIEQSPMPVGMIWTKHPGPIPDTEIIPARRPCAGLQPRI
jgi:hypothetical protein